LPYVRAGSTVSWNKAGFGDFEIGSTLPITRFGLCWVSTSFALADATARGTQRQPIAVLRLLFQRSLAKREEISNISEDNISEDMAFLKT
jgi:hypothetical protein